jgi:hypothetical protein
VAPAKRRKSGEGCGWLRSEVSGDWSQSGVSPPHSKVAVDRRSIVKEQSRLAGFVVAKVAKTLGERHLKLLAHRPCPISWRDWLRQIRWSSRTLRNGRICQSMAVFWGGTDFVSEMSSEILRIDSAALTHRSASYE